MIDITTVELARIVATHYSWQGTGFRVVCVELRSPTEYVHVAILGDTDVQFVAVKEYIDTQLLDEWTDSLVPLAAIAQSQTYSDLSVWATRWF